ncbi:hypothetical protein NQU49_26665, partial [Escherichia coli]|uniref:hypothetical protein n=1 Tax=Escherichia coli TaxID=562 RepID=UPI002117719E
NYPTWPGFYGGEDDSSPYFINGGRTKDELSSYEKWEIGKYEAFENKQRNRGRYQFLPARYDKRTNTQLGNLLSYLNGKRIVGDLVR